MAITELKIGDMFNGPSDLIVLPCSTTGTITPFVRERLVHYNIPYPKPSMDLGDVSIMPFDGGENIAQYVAYAASVRSNSSSKSAIQRIGEQLGKATRDRSTIRLVSAPLLGAGAGGLQKKVVVEALSIGFKSFAHRDARLIMHVLDRKAFQRLSTSSETSRGERKQAQPEKVLRVFISYSHTSQEHEQWVETLGKFLRSKAVEARLDVWHLRRGMNLPQFMTNELALADRVVIVSDEKYAAKADGSIGGVGWETRIIQGEMLNSVSDKPKYLVIVRSEEINQGLPKYLMGTFVIHWPSNASDKQNRGILINELRDIVKIQTVTLT